MIKAQFGGNGECNSTNTHANGASLIRDFVKMTCKEVREWGKSHAFGAKDF